MAAADYEVLMQPEVSAAPPVIDLSLEGPRTQRRLTVAFRFILAVPHFLWLSVLMFVVEFAVAAGWVCAIFIGRMPAGIREFVAKVLRYGTRVYAYAYFLLSDRYPPFALDADDYAVEVTLPPPGRLNRAAVLFRLVLLVPAAIVSTVVSIGAGVSMIVIWLVVLILGRMPRAIFEALSAVLRYQVRFYGFLAMLTSEYPKKLLGDTGLAPDASPIEATAQPLTPLDELPTPPATTPRITRLVLSKAGKRLVILFIVLGVVLYGGLFTVSAITNNQTESARDEFVRIEQEAAGSSGAYQRAIQTCALQGGLPCLQKADLRLADALARFRRQLNAIDFPVRALGAADALDRSVDDFEQAVRNLATSTDAATYQQRFAQVQTAGAAVSRDEFALADALLLRHP